MSPEQAKGRPVEKRSDVSAFGAVLYEILTWQRAFRAEDVSETLAAVWDKACSADATTVATTGLAIGVRR